MAGGTESFGNVGAWVLKLDTDGTVAWQKVYQGGMFSSIQETTDGGYIVAGTYDGDFFILRLNLDGSVAWQKTYGGSSGDNASSIQQTSEGGYIVAGVTFSFGAGDYPDVWVLKLDAYGNLIWQKRYDVDGLDQVYRHYSMADSIQQTSDGGYIIAGIILLPFDEREESAWLLKLNPDGTIFWQKTYGGYGYDIARDVQQTSDGGYIVAGTTGSLGGSSGDFLVLRLDANGETPESYCPIIGTSNVTAIDTDANVRNVNMIVWDTSVSFQETNAYVTDENIIPNGVCPAPDISVYPSPIEFIPVKVGSLSTQTVTISNTGEADLIIRSSITITGTNASEFAIQNDNCSGKILMPSNTCTIDVVFSPASTRLKEATLSIQSNDPVTPSMNVSLKGAGYVGIIAILAPNGGEVIPSGSTYTIQWWAREDMVKFDLLYSLNNGSTWKTIASGITGSSYNWIVPTPTRNKKRCLVKVIGYDASGIKVRGDRSDGVFTIEVVRLFYPYEGMTLKSGSLIPIFWKTNGTIRPVVQVKLFYTINAGSTWKLIKTITGNPGTYDSYDWTVPAVTTTKTQCRVKVVLKDAGGVTIGSDVSDGFFTIQP